MGTKFLKYNWDDSCYGNYLTKIKSEVIYGARTKNKYRKNMHLLDTANCGYQAETNDAQVIKSHASSTAYVISGNEYRTYMNDNARPLVYPNPDVSWSASSALQPGLGTYVKNIGRLINRKDTSLNYPTQTYASYHSSGAIPGTYQFTGGIDIFKFIKLNRIKNVTAVVKVSPPEEAFDHSNNSNIEYYLSMVGIEKLFDKCLTYVNGLPNTGVVRLDSVSKFNSWNSPAVEVGSIRIDTSSDCIEINHTDSTYVNADGDPYYYSAKVTKLADYPADYVTVKHEGTPYEYSDSVKVISSKADIGLGTLKFQYLSNTFNVVDYDKTASSTKTKFLANGGIPSLIQSNVRSGFYNAVADSLRDTVLRKLEGETITSSAEVINLEEAMITIASIMHKHINDNLYHLPAEDEYTPYVDPYYVSNAVFLDINTFKFLFNRIHTEYKALAYINNSILTNVRNNPIGQLLDTNGQLTQYLTMDLPSYATGLLMSYKVVNYSGASDFAVEGRDTAEASDKTRLVNLISAIGMSKFLSIVDVVVRSPVDSPDAIVLAYFINWPRAFSLLSSYEFSLVIDVFFGYINMYARPKSKPSWKSWFKKIVLSAIVVGAAYLIPASEYFLVNALVAASTTATVVGIMTGNSMWFDIATVLGIAAALAGAYSQFMANAGEEMTLDSIKEQILTELRKQFTDRILQTFKYAIELVSYVRNISYQNKFDSLRSGINSNVKIVREAEELITQVELDKNIKEFTYTDNITSVYDGTYEYSYSYRYL